jgi:hypothetical protein
MKICRWQDEIQLVTRYDSDRRVTVFEGHWRCPRSGKTGQNMGGAIWPGCPHTHDCPEFKAPPSDLERFRTWLVQFLRGRLARWRR